MRSIPREDALRLLVALTSLGDDPYRRDDVDVKALTGRPGFRLRVGNYRLVYEVDDGKLVILVISACHRREIYER
ncbi:type II toxin-antitoxin system RelE family toxin [Nocardia grenadensis]|uniref:type II toxin-antitoxin system RelE family toxin n=1 Tax=Nocardia grenadensis TaxID=931537 RepID=UPI000AE0A228|nr:type II toxin-antitoxin system RelE/ParE family toxin [Nocardia grenadensis]